MRKILFFSLIAPLAAFLSMGIETAAQNFAWPVYPDSSHHQISALYGLFQEGYTAGVTLFFHSGIDLPAPPGTPVYAVKGGFVKAIFTPLGPSYPQAFSFWRVAIGDSSNLAECDALMYAHLDSGTIAVQVGQEVVAGQYLGDIVDWIDTSTVEHLHFSRVRYYGNAYRWQTGYNDWRYIGNPLEELAPSPDTNPPVIEPALGAQLLAFFDNDSRQPFAPGESLHGNVDIVSRIYDYHNWIRWRNAPHRLEYALNGDSSLPWKTGVCFAGALGSYAEMQELVPVIYCRTQPCSTHIVWNQDQYLYFILTNSDGDSLIEPDDAAYGWETSFYHNGDYRVLVRAFDQGGNFALDSMTVTLANFATLSGRIILSDNCPELQGATVTVAEGGRMDTTDQAGRFSIDSVGGGWQQIIVWRYGYTAADTVVMMSENREIAMALQPGLAVCGDPNGDLLANVKDITFLINYLYKAGPPPVLRWVADVTGDGAINIKDITHLINHLYKSGPDLNCL